MDLDVVAVVSPGSNFDTSNRVSLNAPSKVIYGKTSKLPYCSVLRWWIKRLNTIAQSDRKPKELLNRPDHLINLAYNNDEKYVLQQTEVIECEKKKADASSFTLTNALIKIIAKDNANEQIKAS